GEGIGHVDLAAVGADRHAEGADVDRDRGDYRVCRRVNHRYCVGEEAVGEVGLAAVRANRHAGGAAADRDRGADRVGRRVDHRYGAGDLVGDVDLAAVGAHRDARETGQIKTRREGDGGADRVRRRVDHRYRVG